MFYISLKVFDISATQISELNANLKDIQICTPGRKRSDEGIIPHSAAHGGCG